jgi:predicted exporter
VGVRGEGAYVQPVFPLVFLQGIMLTVQFDCTRIGFAPGFTLYWAVSAVPGKMVNAATTVLKIRCSFMVFP